LKRSPRFSSRVAGGALLLIALGSVTRLANGATIAVATQASDATIAFAIPVSDATIAVAIPVSGVAAIRSASGAVRRISAAEQARKILRNRRYQKTLPKSRLDRGWRFPFGHLVTVPWLTALVIIVLILIFGPLLIRRLRENDGESSTLEDPASVARPRRAREEIAHAERLAAEGRYSEAVHHLLLIAIDYLARSQSSAARSAHTSREILRSLPREIPETDRTALSDLVRHVEISWFGGRELREAEFVSCLRSCRLIAGEAS